MSCITYSLKGNNIDSDEYYSIVENISNKIISNIVYKSREILDSYKKFIYEEWVEEVRSDEEYAIEILYIGIVIEEYIDYAKAFKEKSLTPYNILNSIRKVKKVRKCADRIKGKLTSKVLLNEDTSLESPSVEDFKSIIKWMKAVGDFKEEVIRLEYWQLFLKNKSKSYTDKFFKLCDDIAVEFYIESKGALGKYTERVADFLKDFKNKYKNREDIIYCGKAEIQYFFNMICAEMMNKIYYERFLKIDKKIIFVPACMRQENNKCQSQKTTLGDKCVACSERCNVKSLTILGARTGCEVYTIEHETDLFKEDEERNEEIGVIGVACVLNLMSGGWKALRIGFIPQCVVLEFPGCENHWLDKKEMTSINYNKLFKMI